MSKETIVIPDIHGRTFWKEAVEKYPEADVIFLGDYLDPYYALEYITSHDAYINFKEILDYARQHPNVTLLLGNHDLHYLTGNDWGRKDRWAEDKVIRKILDNADLFDFSTMRQIGGKRYLFSHAPIFKEWCEYTGMPSDLDELRPKMRDMIVNFKDHRREIGDIWARASRLRGGCDVCGSPVWADVNETATCHFIDGADFYVFGHTQLNKPIIKDNFACLDCHQAFKIDENGNIEAVTVKATPDLPEDTGWF